MKAAFIDSVGPPENIRYADLPDPTPTGAQALVKIGAVNLNPVDTYLRAGTVAMPIPIPYIVGCDLAGEVVAVGPEAEAVSSARSCLGLEPRIARPSGDFRRICRGR